MRVTRFSLYAALVLFVLGIIGLFLWRDARHADSWRICADDVSYIFNYKVGALIVDDYVLADQHFLFDKCGPGIDLEVCSVSLITFVNPLSVSTDNVSFEFDTIDQDQEKIAVVVEDPNRTGRDQSTTIRYSRDGKFLDLLEKTEEGERRFVECALPLFR